ncbi:MAG: tRNA (N6-isopentenyl adenosine(37)-C2)-methylthiotransferase MiaB [Deltaproteobacteria bacterium]|nr:tRNA (N6-isopentenyl adenosine(37)-C2)-methylthiotransferase MiaB [Deltaproteobacteria bacterium]MDZ4342684.1 tRNA (N6-isopentenyl adenosine(37)-C2)-methylthiotransferase MiaB [Candidatus Binatia bacterium]
MKLLFLQTFGCQMNQVDSERIARVMGRMDYTLTDCVENADLILLNTCSVRDKAEQKVYSALGRFKEIKQRRADVIIGVGGCVAQQEGEALLKRVPYLDLVFGTHNIHKLPEIVEQVQTLENRPVETAFYRDPSYMEDPEDAVRVGGAKAFVTIMQGCNKVCSFCIVPHVRGREVSRPSEKIVREVEALANHGVVEVMLLGQNVNSYGKRTPGEIGFAELLARVNAIDGIQRIRFTTSHPQDLSPELIEAYAELEKLCEHLHLPVQSGSDSVLSRMRRGYTLDDYLGRLRRLRARCPEVAISTDIIVGFPGETETEFAATLELLEQVKYDEIYSFTYSPRPQTVAAKLYDDDIPDGIKKERLTRLQNLQRGIALCKNRERIGAVEAILVEGRAKLNNGQIMGRTRSNRIVNAFGPEGLVGELLPVRITGATATSLIGEPAGAVAASDLHPEGEFA